MDYYDIIAGSFQATIEAIALSVDDLAPPIEGASQLMAQALLEDRKVIACGNGVDGTVAQLFATTLLNRFEHDRPALPALALGADGAGITAIAQASGINDIFSRQLRALGQPGDVLLCISSGDSANNLLRAAQAAHERNMMVVALSNAADTQLGTLIRAEDIEIRVDAARTPRIVEMHTMVVHCLCELLDHSLFGAYSQE
jgi:D-sedoheptulose 7-phosphate isomerase